ncbi:hypothetical protein ACFV6E_09800 [Streptomyces sp. NPDC059785]|uniref:hypothetical protein n=1 Tax=Streptomyces sp. NPDC059785 TaxID=3346945 RepID=UPI0036582F64
MTSSETSTGTGTTGKGTATGTTGKGTGTGAAGTGTGTGSRTTPPRPLDIEALFPELAAHRGTTTRLHPRPGAPDVTASSVGGPLLWPADEPWPVCTEPHHRNKGRRPADIHRRRRVLAEAWARSPDSGPTDEERSLLDDLDRKHEVPDLPDTAPIPMIGVAQLYRRDLPDLAEGPDGRDLLQVFWCPFDRHGPTGYGMSTALRWHHSENITDPLPEPPLPQVIGYDGYLAEPCVLHPEQVTTYPFAGLLPEDLCARIDEWEDERQEEYEEAVEAAQATAFERARQTQGAAESEAAFDAAMKRKPPRPAGYQYDLSIPPGWRVGGYASWHLTDPTPMNCRTCATPLHLLLTIDSKEWDGGSGSWRPVEDETPTGRRLATPTEVTVGRWGELNIFTCPADPGHGHRWSIQ